MNMIKNLIKIFRKLAFYGFLALKSFCLLQFLHIFYSFFYIINLTNINNCQLSLTSAPVIDFHKFYKNEFFVKFLTFLAQGYLLAKND